MHADATGSDPPASKSAAPPAGVAGPVRPKRATRLRPLGLNEVELAGSGALGDWQHRNRVATLPHCTARVVSSGALGNLERIATGVVQGTPHVGMVFSDSDVYKTLEAIAWEHVRGIDAPVEEFAARATRAITDAQRADGYLNSWFQRQRPDAAWKDLRWGHELYCAGHLLQASVAAQRTGTLPGLAAVAERLVEHLLGTFSSADGDGRLIGICGHPEIETALVEHYRQTGDERVLGLATHQIDLRGRADVELSTTDLPGGRPFSLSYFLHHLPVRQRRSATGHAVRELYLQSGVVDVATETGDENLLAASEAIWEDLYAAKTYLTGAHGSRHRDESIGDPYELPSDRAYAETCAAIASFQWNWRLLLATGRARYADAMERVLWNTVAGATSRDGESFFYSNTLHLRTSHEDEEDAPRHRLDWYECACCPPNLARLVASVQSYLATSDDSGLQLHLPFDGKVRTRLAGSPVSMDIRTDHPWDGDTQIIMEDCAPTAPWTLSVRIPRWSELGSFRVVLNGEAIEPTLQHDYLTLSRTWRAGDRVQLANTMPLRLVAAHPRVDAVRGCVALERGPLVYCVESDDLPPGVAIEDLVIDDVPVLECSAKVPAGLEDYVKVAISASARLVGSTLQPLYGEHHPTPAGGETAEVRLIPYFARAHRPSAAMRVWLPTAPLQRSVGAMVEDRSIQGTPLAAASGGSGYVDHEGI